MRALAEGPANSFKTDLEQITGLQKTFDTALGLDTTGEAIRSYNPVLARWNFEKVKPQSEKRESYKRYEVFSMQTNLRERYHAAKSSIVYTFDEFGNAYSELFPDEPFEMILQRGVEYRKGEGSLELQREENELSGSLRIMKKLTDPATPLGAKFVSISPPGIVESTTYKDNFVDVFELVKDPKTGQRVVKMTRHASDMRYGEYWDAALKLRPDYFDNVSGPIDAWFLGRPIYIDPHVDKRTVDDLFVEVFKRSEDAMREEVFQEIYTACLPLILYYVDVLCSESFDPEKVAIAFNAVLKKGDLTRDLLRNIEENTYDIASGASQRLRSGVIFGSVAAEAAFLGRQKIDKIGAGCGFSGGYDLAISKISSIESALANSVAKFGLKKESSLQKKSDEEKYDFDKYATCAGCIQEKQDHSKKMVGPCYLCKPCDELAKKGRLKKAA